MLGSSPYSNAVRRNATAFRVFLVLNLMAVGPLFADLWYQHYQKAEEALKAERWDEAVVELNQAIQRRGDSGARVRTYGMRTTDYFPYLKLGIAYLALGQEEAALQAFDTEERLGAIEGSENAFQELESLRERAAQMLESRRAEDQDRIQQILAESLREARELQAEARVGEAMTALGRGLSVAPEDPEATGLMAALQGEARQRDQKARAETRASMLVTEGRGLLDEGAYAEAASRFRQASELVPGNQEVSALLEDSQRRLRTEVENLRLEETRAGFIKQELDEVRKLEVAGQLDEALNRLQTIIAVQEGDEEARAIESRLIQARARAEEELATLQSLTSELASSEDEFESGRFENALSAANRALAVDPGNRRALELVARSYQQLSRVLLGRAAAGNLPPAIRFADFRQEQEDGSLVQVVRDSGFRLSGVIIDNSPVVVDCYDGSGSRLESVWEHQQVGDFYVTEFHVDKVLERGLETFRVVVTDAEDLESSSEYSVAFSPPWFRSTKLMGVVVSVAAMLVLAALLARRNRRARRRHRRFNPYMAGAPVLDEGLFFGREQLIDRILQTIHNNSLLLYGERRIGKTSIQHHLKKRLEAMEDPSYEFFPVYVDLQGTPESRFFATLADDVFSDLEPHLGGLTPSRSLNVEIEYSYRDFVRDLRSVIQRLVAASAKQVKLVLLIDEVDELNDYDPRINQRLRSLFMKSFAENLVAVVSGVEIKKQWEREGSPWYNFFEEIEVLPFRVEDARALIERPIAGVLKLEEGVVPRIIELTGLRPYLIQKICIALVNRAYENGARTITVGDVEAIGRPEVA
ncbi:MAG: AAA family ATPase [Thermoanaerobaculia bacterium]